MAAECRKKAFNLLLQEQVLVVMMVENASSGCFPKDYEVQHQI